MENIKREDRLAILESYEKAQRALTAIHSIRALRAHVTGRMALGEAVPLSEVHDVLSCALQRYPNGKDALGESLSREVQKVAKTLEAGQCKTTTLTMPQNELAALVVIMYDACNVIEADCTQRHQRLEATFTHQLAMTRSACTIHDVITNEIQSIRQRGNGHNSIISLSGQRLSEQHLSSLGSVLSDCTRLTMLELTASGITDAHFAPLLYLLRSMQHLVVILLSQNQLTDASGAILIERLNAPSDFPALKVLDVADNHVSARCMERLRLAMLQREKERVVAPEAWAVPKHPGGKPFRILCLDGGGVRGLVEIEILTRLEAITKQHPDDLFDLIVGTSTGGILATALRQRLPLAKCKELYIHLATYLFGKTYYTYYLESGARFLRAWSTGGDWYSSSYLAQIINERLQGAKAFKDNTGGKPTAVVSVDASSGQEHMFRSYDVPNAATIFPHGSTAHTTTEVLRATSSAPTFFSPITLDGKVYEDGGVGYNNPSLLAMCEALRTHSPGNITLVSLGTGYDGTDKADHNERSLVLKTLALSVKKVLVDTEPVHQTLLLMAQAEKFKYFRVNPTATSSVHLDIAKIPLDEDNVSVLEAMCAVTQQYLTENEKLMQAIAAAL